MDINCAVIGYTAAASTANLAPPAPNSQFPRANHSNQEDGGPHWGPPFAERERSLQLIRAADDANFVEAG